MANNHIPALRLGKPYKSLDKNDVLDHRTGEKLSEVSQCNAGIIRRDMPKFATARALLRKFTSEELLAISAKAGDLFMNGALPLGDATQTPDDYIKNLSASSGLPHVMVRRNMRKIHQVFTEMRTILRGLTRGMDLRVLDDGVGEHGGSPVSFYPTTQALGVILPSNSPGVNSLWMPALALKIPVILKPGREEPWTPFRIIQAFIAAGLPAEAFGFYPADHDGAAEILNSCGRALLFGDESTTSRWAGNPGIQIHGPGRSKVLIGDDCIENWSRHLDVLCASLCDNGGRSCVNASAIIVPKHGREIAKALGQRLATLLPKPPEDASAPLSAFANVKMAEWIDETISDGLKTPGAEDVTAKHRGTPRKQILQGGTYLCPTIVHCDSFEHPLANREFLFPYASVVEIPERDMLSKIGKSLVVSAITENPNFIDALLASPLIDRLNIGPSPTTRVDWDQPHEGNLFEFMYKRRAIAIAIANAKRTAPTSTSAATLEPLRSFGYVAKTQVIFAPNAIDQLGAVVRQHGGRRALLVTDAGIVLAGHIERAKAVLAQAGVEVAVFDGVQENPTTRHVAACVAAAQRHGADVLIGFGGGSSMDTAKGANFLLSNGGAMADYWGINKASKPFLPLVAVPTTAGTGSECQCYALVADDTTHQKMACGDEKAYPRVALLDPALSVTMPRRVTANTAVDTLTHALESHVTAARTAMSQIFSRESWVLAQGALETVLNEPENVAARGRMLLASAYGGMAIAQSMLGAAHAAANPLTARFNVIHGQAVGLMLPHVIRFNSADPEALRGYAELAIAAGLTRAGDDPQKALAALLVRVQQLLKAAEIPASLNACGVPKGAIPSLAEEAAKQWTAGFNPRKITRDDFAALYGSAFLE